MGMIFTKIGNLIEKFKMQYILHCLAEHGRNCHLEGKCTITSSTIHMGENVFIGGGNTFLSTGAHIYIGNNVMFGPNVSIVTGNHRTDVIGKYMVDVKEKRDTDDQSVVIEDDVWIGMGATILKGVTIGKGSIIGAGTIITKNVEPYSIISNKQELRIRKRFDDDEIDEHERILRKQ